MKLQVLLFFYYEILLKGIIVNEKTHVGILVINSEGDCEVFSVN